jgi:drug/metabolite transporter (DMT)-like permease
VSPGTSKGALCGLAAAALFGASAPLSKRLLPEVQPLVLSGLLYVGAALGLGLAEIARRLSGARAAGSPREASLSRADLLPLGAILVIGGMVSPLLMLTGLGRVSGLAGALLLNLEAPFTMLIAVLIFREHLAGVAAAACALVVGGALVLARPWAAVADAGGLTGDLVGVACIAGACLGWGLDNNLSQRLSLKDPRQIVLGKTLGAGTLSLLTAALLGLPWPRAGVIGPALLIGAFSYGASLLLDMYALRILGAAREAAYFATAPFLGALLALPLLGDRPGAAELGAGALMIAGVLLLARERHSHAHTHEAIEHEHLHVHDDHHRHSHDGPVAEPHSHKHRHDPITHEHPHVPDVHHRHRH